MWAIIAMFLMSCIFTLKNYGCKGTIIYLNNVRSPSLFLSVAITLTGFSCNKSRTWALIEENLCL
jgi:hypothetical protein